jgi:hypothetical protein
VTARRMFGGLAFLLDGNMCCGVLGDGAHGVRGARGICHRAGPSRMDQPGGVVSLIAACEGRRSLCRLSLRRTPHRRGAHSGFIAFLGDVGPLSLVCLTLIRRLRSGSR